MLIFKEQVYPSAHFSRFSKNKTCNRRNYNSWILDICRCAFKENADHFASFFHSSFNTSVTKSEFRSVLKKEFKDIYRPVSILPNVPKIFGRCMFRQKNEYMSMFLSRHQCRFRKGYSAQQCLLTMLEKWKSAAGNKKYIGAITSRLVLNIWFPFARTSSCKVACLWIQHSCAKNCVQLFENRKERTKINSASCVLYIVTFSHPLKIF